MTATRKTPGALTSKAAPFAIRAERTSDVPAREALAGAHMAVVAKAGIKQRFPRNDVGRALRTDRERSGFRGEGDVGLPQGSHGTSVLASHGVFAPWEALFNYSNEQGTSRRTGSRSAKPLGEVRCGRS